ncbi:hypothetical protein N7488_004697 [Penicillium malachiteum]|nr:hypothetical protein N7488_004697 [Penicillium malachiteum]
MSCSSSNIQDFHSQTPPNVSTEPHARSPSPNLPTELAPLNTSKQDDEEKVQRRSFRSRVRNCNYFWLDTWRFEAIVLLFSIACFIAICIVLMVFQNRVRPEMAYDLSLNAIVSVLATGCKSALILVVGEAICQLKWLHFSERRKLSDIQEFEEASRGALGSFTILIHHRANSLVSIGAAVVVLMLAFEPFMQQLISYPVRPVKLQNGQATAKQLHNFGTDNNFKTSEPLDDPFEEIDIWEDSFTQGVWLDGSFDSEPVCSSGDCAWETFSSLGAYAAAAGI